MPVDLQKDIRRLSETEQRVPGLREACALALGIVNTAQRCKRNKLTLQNLAHSTADYLVSIARYLHGRSNGSRIVGTKLQDLIHELERVLQDVSTAVQKYSVLSLKASIEIANERDNDINRLKERLQELQGTIFSLHEYDDISNYHIGLTVQRSQSVANSQHRSGLDIRRPETTKVSHSHSEFVVHPLPRRGYPFSTFGLEQDISRSPKGAQATLSDHSFDISDAVPRIESPRFGGIDRPPSRTILSRLKRRPVPDLTKDISNIQHTYLGGRYGDIYSGILSTSGNAERVALKSLRVVNQITKIKKKFQQEVDIWRFLHHPNVLPFYGTATCGSDSARLFMVSPWAENGKCLDYLQHNPHANRGDLLYQTSDALKYLHSGKDVPPIIHGDVKADNVLISPTRQALLCDFGLSRYAEGGILSSSSNANGTVRFMAPELLIGRENIPASSKPTKESDVYAFGSLMIQIYTGKLPFGEIPEPAAILMIADRKVPTRPTEAEVLQRGLDDDIWTLMNDCWSADPNQRPSMRDVTWKLLWKVALRDPSTGGGRAAI